MTTIDDNGFSKFKIPSHLLPKALYHITHLKNVESILKTGLQLGSPRATSFGKIRGIYLTDDPEEVLRSGDYFGSDWGCVTVDIKGSYLYFDPEFYGDHETPELAVEGIKKNEVGIYVYSKSSIPRDKIINCFYWNSSKRFEYYETLKKYK